MSAYQSTKVSREYCDDKNHVESTLFFPKRPKPHSTYKCVCRITTLEGPYVWSIPSEHLQNVLSHPFTHGI